MKNFIIFVAGFGLAIAFVALGMYGMDPGFISFTSPSEYWAIQAHRQQKDSTFFVVGQKDIKHISEWNSQNELVVLDSSTNELNKKKHMEVMNVLQLGQRNLLHDAGELEPHIKDWIDEENNHKIRGKKKLYKKNIVPVVVNMSLLYKERFGIVLDGEWCTVCIQKLSRRKDGLDEKSILSCSGYLEGKEESSVVFSSRGDIVSGSIRTPWETYSLRPAPASKNKDAIFQVHILGNIDQGAFAECGCNVELPCKCDKCKCVDCCCRFDCR